MIGLPCIPTIIIPKNLNDNNNITKVVNPYFSENRIGSFKDLYFLSEIVAIQI